MHMAVQLRLNVIHLCLVLSVLVLYHFGFTGLSLALHSTNLFLLPNYSCYFYHPSCICWLHGVFCHLHAVTPLDILEIKLNIILGGKGLG